MNELFNYRESPVKEAKRKEIILGAKLIFIDRGIHYVTMKDIASACNVSLRSLYYYYLSKEDLAVDVMIFAMTELGDIFSTGYDDGLNAYENLAVMLHHLGNQLNQRKDVIKYITAFDFYFFKSYPNERYSTFLKSFQQNNEIAKIVETSLIDHSIDYHKRNPYELLSSIMQALLAFAQKMIYREDVVIREQLPGYGDYSIIIQFYLDALKAR